MKQIAVKYIQRKPIPNFHFSVEVIFKDVKDHLPSNIDDSTLVVSNYSTGLLNRFKILKEVWAKKGEINHITGDISYVGIILPKAKTVQTILDVFFLTDAKGIRFFILWLFWLWLPVKRAKRVTCISEATKADILKHVNCNPDKLEVIPIALSPVFKQEARTYNFKKPNIIQIGHAPNKNVVRTLEAIKDIDCHLNIIGKHTESYQNLLDTYNIDHTYEYGLSQEDMKVRYQKADILIFASTLEGFGMPIIEAQAMGTVVITSNLSSMPDVAGGAALLVDPYATSAISDAVKQIMEDESLQKKLIADGYENVKRFDPSVISQQYADIYTDIHNTK